MKRSDLRTVARYFLSPTLPGFANGHASRIVDLSIQGARMETVEPCQPGEQVSLTIVSSGRQITVAGKVLWCEIDTLFLDDVRDRYLTGIAFAQPSAAVDELLDELCGNGTAVRIEDLRDTDRYNLVAPLTGSFGEISPISVLDLSARGARIATAGKMIIGAGGHLRFQVDGEAGPVDVYGRVVWTTRAFAGGEQAGLSIASEEETMSGAIQRLCVRGEARIDLDSLRRKFDQLRARHMRQKMVG